MNALGSIFPRLAHIDQDDSISLEAAGNLGGGKILDGQLRVLLPFEVRFLAAGAHIGVGAQ